MEIFKTAGNTAMGGVVTFINATVTMHGINEGLAIMVGLLTSIYLVCQIRKSIKKKKDE
jgi:ABC-type phosphate transport system permease subunit